MDVFCRTLPDPEQIEQNKLIFATFPSNVQKLFISYADKLLNSDEVRRKLPNVYDNALKLKKVANNSSELMEESKRIYYGSIQCEGVQTNKGRCKNKAYYQCKDKYLCGVHSKKYTDRQELPKDPNKKENRQKAYDEHLISVRKEAKQNFENNRYGKVICTKIRMMKECPTISEFLKVYPNYKHQNKEDGFGCSSLSPMSIGPVDTKQPGLPPAKNLENMHQGNKVFPSEVDAKGEIKKEFFATQRAWYLDPVPHRHKEKRAPLFSVWVRSSGEIVRKNYFETRQMYCTFYEQGV